MRYNLNQFLLDHANKPITEERDGSPEAVVLGELLERACLYGGDPSDDAKTKYAQYKLAQKVAVPNPHCDLTSEEVTRLKELCAKAYAAIAYGAIVDALECAGAEGSDMLDSYGGTDPE